MAENFMDLDPAALERTQVRQQIRVELLNDLSARVRVCRREAIQRLFMSVVNQPQSVVDEVLGAVDAYRVVLALCNRLKGE